MAKILSKGKVQTVLGLIDSDKLGFTLMHEHLLSDFRCLMPESEQNTEKGRNLLKNDGEALISETIEFRKAGGGTIVDVTPLPIPGRNPEGLALIAENAGINIIMGVSYYTEPFYGQELDMDSMSAGQIAKQYTDEIKYGFGNTGIRPGIIGEAGCSWPLTSNERKCLHAAAIAQQETGLCISIHPGSHPESPRQIVDILASSGVETDRIIIGHIEETIPPDAVHLRFELAATGCYLAFDTFSVPEDALPPFAAKLGDAGRIDQIAELIGHGYGKQILVSHDSLAVDLMAVNGGPGLVHIPGKVVPDMKAKGLSEQDIRLITVENPSRSLSIR